MTTISEIKIIIIVIKSKFLALFIGQNQLYDKIIEELTFNSRFEDSIFIVLQNKWDELHWLFVATGTILGIIYALMKILGACIS
ncbi:MAG: hypothetical protein WC009_13205 [Methylotenera sp.]|nr:hypothetical protein [Methylotenera sp.]MDD4925744.1 hypothetical protein [Methylotenera sp.]